MSETQISADPEDRMGVYKRIEDVPTEYRLSNYEAEYRGRDVLREYLTEKGYDGVNESGSRAELVVRSWFEHMERRGRHHALAEPADVEAWCQSLLDSMGVYRAYNPYFVRIESFYEWLQGRTDHEHRYHPVLMAAAVEGSAAQEIWQEKISTRNYDR